MARWKPKPLSPSVTHALANLGYTLRSEADVDRPATYAHALAPDLRIVVAPSPRSKTMMLVQFTAIPPHLVSELDRRAHVLQVQELTEKLATWEQIIIAGRARGPLLIDILGQPPTVAPRMENR